MKAESDGVLDESKSEYEQSRGSTPLIVELANKFVGKVTGIDAEGTEIPISGGCTDITTMSPVLQVAAVEVSRKTHVPRGGPRSAADAGFSNRRGTDKASPASPQPAKKEQLMERYTGKTIWRGRIELYVCSREETLRPK